MHRHTRPTEDYFLCGRRHAEDAQDIAQAALSGDEHATDGDAGVKRASGVRDKILDCEFVTPPAHRIIWLNHDKHVKAGGGRDTDQWPMPFLFEQQHHKWESFFLAWPFDRIPDLSALKECIPCVGYDYYTKTTPLVIKRAEKRLETMRTARAQERIRDRASKHSAHEAAAAAARVQSSIVSFGIIIIISSSSSSGSSSSSNIERYGRRTGLPGSTSSSSGSSSSSSIERYGRRTGPPGSTSSSSVALLTAGTGSGSAAVGQTRVDAPWNISGAQVAKKRRNNHQQRPGGSFFVNFALNTNPRLQDALRDAIRDVAELDYKAIAQHFNRQFVKMTLPS